LGTGRSYERVRESLDVTQVQLAGQLGITQGNVSRVEGRSDVYLSTLRAYVEGLGRRLEIAAVFGNERLAVSVGRRDAVDDDENAVAVSGKRPARGASPRRPRSTSSSGLKDDAGSARLEREKEAVAKIQERPGITAAELANAMGRSRNISIGSSRASIRSPSAARVTTPPAT
jgi:transcriptional regulator with XRE-family HTH domain